MKQKTLYRISRILGGSVLILMILVMLPLAVPRIFGCHTYNVVSPSMEPELPLGSLLIVKPVDPQELKTDDIAVFYSNGIVVSHRVVKNDTETKKLTTKGDANESKLSDFAKITVDHVPILQREPRTDR